MTIGIAILCGDGFVLAADRVGEVVMEHSVWQRWSHVRKIARVRDFNIGTLAFGMGGVGTDSVRRLVHLFGLSERARLHDSGYTVKAVATGLSEFLRERMAGEVPGSVSAGLGMIVAGYSEGSTHPELYRFRLPGESEPREVHFGSSRRGIVFEGEVNTLHRLLHGCDPVLAQALCRVNFGEEQLNQLRDALRDGGVDETTAEEHVRLLAGGGETAEVFASWLGLFSAELRLQAMPIQDAVDVALWLIEAAIGRSRFGMGRASPGDEADVAVVTEEGFSWIQRERVHGYLRRMPSDDGMEMD
ncbi:MAG: hypothetical protein M1389_12975 [Chloroflexi bacterium]|nr:hypothetical protein [Chloroflexota bacterium]